MADIIHPDTRSRLEEMGLAARRLPRVVMPTHYQVELMLGALISTFFFLVYVSLIPLLVWALYRLALRSWIGLGTAASSHPIVWLPVVLLIGCLLLLSLLKPLVASPGPAATPHFLNADQEPLLFAMVKELASAGGMPAPSEIAVDCSVNSCTVYAGGASGWFRSGSVLVVGLPLVAGLRLDQFAGVIAHELVHAAQATAMWSSRCISGVNAWFSRVACERDAVDEQILRLCETAGAGARLSLGFAKLLFQPGRAVLRVLMWAESAATSVFLRRLELEADGYQVRVAGTEAFVSTVLELNLLAVAAQRAVVELSRMWRDGQLVDNYPGLIAGLRGRYSEGFIQRILAGLEHGRTGIFSAHPCDRERIALARSETSEGVLTSGLPASALLTDYQNLCQEVTLEFYDRELHLQREGCHLVPLESVFQKQG